MSDKKGLLAGVIGLGTALVSLGRDIVTVWREKEPAPRKADRTAADELARLTRGDGGKR